MTQTLVLDRRFKGVGRVKKASGTTNAKVFVKLNAMLTTLYEEGRLDVLRAIRSGELPPLVVYGTMRAGVLPAAGGFLPLAPAMRQWIDSRDDISPEHRHSLITSWRRFEQAAPKAMVSDLPAVLRRLRVAMAAHARSFNLAKACAQAFARAHGGRRSPIYLELQDIDGRTATAGRAHHPMTPAELRALCPEPENWVHGVAWTMATTGMGPKEMWGGWHRDHDRVHIQGTKRAGRVRDVPLVMVTTRPLYGRKAWEDAFRALAKGRYTPYDLRRTYANWLEAAGVPRIRRKLYLGHGARDVTDLYERHEVAAFLKEDAKKIQALLSKRHTKAHPTGSKPRGKGR